MTGSRWRIHRLDDTASTNDDARHAAEAGEGEGYVVIAKRQSSGRGRQGRVWQSPEGNLYCSIILQPRDMPQQAGFYSFVAALAVRDTVVEAISSPLEGEDAETWVCASKPLVSAGEGVTAQDHTPSPVKTKDLLRKSKFSHPLPQGERGHVAITLKWPNDVLVGGKKISGILLEVSGDALIVGIGINVAHCPDQVIYPTTSLQAEGAGAATTDVLDILLHNIGYWHDVMQKQGFAAIRAAWLEHAGTGALTVRLPQETVQGQFAGLDETGHLRLLLEDGAERVISTGDVLFLRP